VGLNVLGVQGVSQEPNALVTVTQNQVSLQHQLLTVQATLTRQDELPTSALGALGPPPRGHHATGRCRIHAFDAFDSAARCGAAPMILGVVPRVH
jgi:hypothetical protein